jgi:hypothetical protein
MAVVKHDSSTDIFTGQIFLFLGGLPIAYGKSATLNVSVSEVDISNKMVNGGWGASQYGKKTYTIGSESLVTYKEGQLSFETLLDMIDKGENVEFFLGQAKVSEETTVGGKFEPDMSKPYRKGSAMITSLDLNSTDGEIATCSTSLTGVGGLEKGEVTPPTT